MRGGTFPADLVVLTIPGVQRFISEARTTADLVSASTQVGALARAAVDVLRRPGVRVVIPAFPESRSDGAEPADDVGMPNRVVALVEVSPSGPSGGDLARLAADAVRAEWRRWLTKIFKAGAPETPSFPDPQWVCVPASAGGYAVQFELAQQALAARRRLRSFVSEAAPGRELCSLSVRWPAEPQAPKGARAHERAEKLSAASWVKRCAAHREERVRVPSTFAIASAPFRAEVLRRVREPRIQRALLELHEVARPLGRGDCQVVDLDYPTTGRPEVDRAATWLWRSGGAWVDVEQWQAATVQDAQRESGESSPIDVPAGRMAAVRLAEAVGHRSGTHLAVVLQDLDSMGLFLSGRARPSGGGPPLRVSPEEHERVSTALNRLAQQQLRTAVASLPELPWSLFGAPVYVGGDDLLMLAPAATAIRLAEVMHDAVPAELPHASTAVYFFSQRASLQQAIRRAHDLLEEAKSLEGKHGLAIGYERRSGTTHHTVSQWKQGERATAASVFAGLSGPGSVLGRLSPRLVFDLERDSTELAGLLSGRSGQVQLLRAEIRRLVLRHSEVVGLGGQASGRSHAEIEAHRAAAGEFADLLVDLGRAEGARRLGGTRFDPVPLARVGVFLRQEAR